MPKKKIFSIFKKVFYSCLVIMCLLLLWYGELVVYGIRQGIGQFQLIWYAKDFKTFLKESKYHDTLKTKFAYKLELIKAIKKFAVDSLGMKNAGSYEKIFDQKNKPLLWAVTACEPYQFVPHTWDYGPLGLMPYKGFFDSTSAQKLALSLEKRGYDVNIFKPSAWSTLGWLSDPVLSTMLYWQEGDLASLIIHELTHSTIWVTGDVEYNENLADFIGDEGALLFMRHHYGKNSKQEKKFVEANIDNEVFFRYALKSTKRLDSLYKSFTKEAIEKFKKAKKDTLILNIVNGLADIGLYNGAKYAKRYRKKLPNNAFFMNFMRYRAKQDDFKKEFYQVSKGNLKKYIEYLKNK
ncbi:MAG: aminopeptidase [Cytophagia bacterium]|nr:MAG: aminopeptidase [Cytophagia bacterium]